MNPHGPATILRDNFNRANENPVSQGGEWAKNGNSAANMRVVSNAVNATAVNATGAFRTNETYGPDSEACLDITTAPTGTGFIGVLINLVGVAGSATWSGYYIVATATNVQIQKIDNAGAGTTGLGSAATALVAGDKILGRYFDGSLYGWVFIAATSTWTMFASAADTTYKRTGKIGMRGSGTVYVTDNFIGGDVPPPKHPAINFQNPAVLSREWRRDERSRIWLPNFKLKIRPPKMAFA